MINLDINSDKTFVYYSTYPNSVTRIGDIVMLSKVPTKVDFVDSRSPWSFLFQSQELRNFGGRNTNNNDVAIYDGISLTTEHYKIEDLINIDGQKFSLALLQAGVQYSLAVLTDCSIREYNRDNKKLDISFIANKCEMIYDR